MRILFCASELIPFAKAGGLADVAGSLPLALEELNQEVAIVVPFYKLVKESGCKPKALSSDIFFTNIGKRIKVYFIKNDKYFNRDEIYGDINGDYPDNIDRFSFFCRKTLELIRKIDFKPDVIHCNDWQTALIPVYLKTKYKDDPIYKNIKTVFTIHNFGYQGLFVKEEFPKLGLDDSLFNIEGLEFYDKINLLKGGLVFSDVLTTVSPSYAEEIQTEEGGFGLDGVLCKRRNDFYGILNGLDYKFWDPKRDDLIFKKYSPETLQDKYVNKQELKKICNLDDNDLPLFGFVGRLVKQKGLDIFGQAIEQIAKLDAQFVILGTGEERYHKLLDLIAKKYPKHFSVHLKFDERLAHQIYAGSDVFIMPSHYEPCGLGQMISFKYGTIPLVYNTGGLADTVNKKNGFVFQEYTKDGFLDAVKKAIDAYENKKKWADMIKRAFDCDFSWKSSAKKYASLYKKII